MDIIDIKFSGDQVYMLKSFQITSKEYEQMASFINYEDEYQHYGKCKNHNVENMMFPPFNYSYYSYFFMHKKIPTPKELFKEYISINRDNISLDEKKINIVYKEKDYPINDFLGRLYRTYPSLVRDFHYFLMLKEYNNNSKFFSLITYSCKDDYEGKDIIVIKDNVSFVISLMAKTTRSNIFKKQKNKTRHNYKRENEIIIPLDLKTANKYGSIYLYSHKDVKFSIDQVKKHLNIC